MSRRGLPTLAAAHALSATADGIYLVALPWLALGQTGSGAALGGVLAAAALPRAAFLVVGGAWADRVPPRRTLAASSLASAAVTATLALLAGADALPMAALYAAAAVLGVSDAVAYPAASALVPRLAEPARLHRAHALLGGLTQAATFVGPALAAGLLAWGGPAGALAACAALSVGAAAVAAALPRASDRAAVAPPPASALADVRAGLAYVAGHRDLRAAVGLLAGLNLALAGPVLVGGALLAEARLGGAGAFGALAAAWGAGGLAGAGAAALRRPGRPLAALTGATAAMGVGLLGLALPVGVAGALAVAAALGLASGWSEVQAAAWMQAQTAPEMQGRVAGVVALVAVGAEPVSYALAGAAAGWGPDAIFVGGGVLALGSALATALAGRRPNGP